MKATSKACWVIFQFQPLWIPSLCYQLRIAPIRRLNDGTDGIDSFEAEPEKIARWHLFSIVGIAFLAMLLQCKTAYADEQTSPDPVIAKLQAGTSSAQAWWWGWAGGYAAMTIGQGAVALVTSDSDLRINMLVGASSSFLGFGFVLLTDFPARYAVSELDQMPDETEQARATKHQRARELLCASAQAENDGRSWIIHVLGITVAAAQGLILWLAFDLPVDGAINAAVSLLISEAQIWTQPTRAIADWQATSSEDTELHLAIVPNPGGVGLALTF